MKHTSEFCSAVLPSDQSIILVKRGVRGYWPSKEDTRGPAAEARCRELNERIGVTAAQAEAMLAGSMFGFDTPAADPAIYDQEGRRQP